MKIDKLSRLFEGYQAQSAAPSPTKSEGPVKTSSQEATKVSIGGGDGFPEIDNSEKVARLKKLNDEGKLSYDSVKVAGSIIKELGL